MEKQNFQKRVLYPAVIAFTVMATSWVVYNLAWRIDIRSIHQILASIFGTLLFLSVTFAPLIIYPTVYFKGASLSERILISLANPFLWATKENIRLSVSYSFAECLYYYLNPLSVALLFGAVAQMGLAELCCRWRLTRKGEVIAVLSPGALASLILGLALVVVVFTSGQGETAYVLFLSGYRKIFGAGV